jgi:YD repeat-containing protein
VSNIYVPNGEYTLRADFSGAASPSDYEDFVIALTWQENIYAASASTVIGGIRVKKIIDDDGGGNQKARLFTYSLDDGSSTGYLVTTEPVYEYAQYCGTADAQYGPVIIRTSTSNLPLGTTQGSPIGYAIVTVTTDEQGSQGKTCYYYTTALQFEDITQPPLINPLNVVNPLFGGYPFAPTRSLDHRRGLLIKQEEYRKDAGNFILLHSVENQYEPLLLIPETLNENSGGLYDETMGIKYARAEMGTGGYAIASYYKTISEWIRPVKTIERFYLPNGVISFEKVTNTEYQNLNHLQVTKTHTVESNGTENHTYLKYPLDFVIPSGTSDPISLGIKKLRDGNFISSVIESYSTRKTITDTEEKIVSSILTTYDASKPLPREIHVSKTVNDLLLSTFSPAAVHPSTGAFTKDTRYEKRVEFTDYDADGNLLEQFKTDDVKNAYIWGYDNSLPIAEVTNAANEDVYHSSFEEDGVAFTDGNGKNISRTGVKVYNSGNYSIPMSFNPVAPSNILMSYWYWQNNTWNFSGEVAFNRNITTGGSKLDEIRAYPKNARMTTYTHEVGIGVKQVTDVNGHTMTYEYDPFGRLHIIRDKDGNIVQRVNYHYKNQPTSNQPAQ